MWFNPRAALAEIEDGTPANPATSASPTPRIAGIAAVAGGAGPNLAPEPQPTPKAKQARQPKPVPQPRPAPGAKGTPAKFPHGTSAYGHPKTWTGRIVSLEAWRQMTNAERNGPGDKMHCGNCKQWVPREDAHHHIEGRCKDGGGR